MNSIVPVFQFEIRYDHILNFSEIGRKLLSPFVKLSQSIKIDNQNTLNERIILNFEDDNYTIIVSWDRIILKGQNNVELFTGKNSPLEMPFFLILEKLKNLEEFGSIKNILYIIIYIKKLKLEESELYNHFAEKFHLPKTKEILDTPNDMAVLLEDNLNEKSETILFGPYTGISDLDKRPLSPLNKKELPDVDFHGVICEYKKGFLANDVNFIDFKKLVEISKNKFSKVCKML